MEDKNNSFELRSEEVQEILTRVPHWIIRWGSIVILSIVLILLTVSWLIEYPDLISTQIIITTKTPPEKIVARTSGKVEALLIENNTVITKNTPIAVIESTADYNDVFLLKSITDTINIEKSRFPFHKIESAQLGEIENSFAVFQKEYSVDELNRKLQPYKIEETAQSLEAIQLRERLALLESQKIITQGELELKKSDVNRHETLYGKGIISTQEIEKKRFEYLQEQKNFKNILSNISSIKSSINELNKNSRSTQINESKETVNLERNLLQSFFLLKKAIKDWELNYVLRSSINGKVSFLQIWTENQTINAGENVFVITPTNTNDYIGKLKAPVFNSGKIKMGQVVNIRINNYPDREFGILKGVIDNISLTPDKDGNLLIDVSLPEGLTTSYKKKLLFQQEMSGSADIVTEDLRLIERVLYQLKDVFRR